MKKAIKKIISTVMAVTIAALSVASGLSASASAPTQQLYTYRSYFYLKPNSGVTRVVNKVELWRYSNGGPIVAGGFENGNIGDTTTYTGYGMPSLSINISTVEFNSPTNIGGLLNTFKLHTYEPYSYVASSNSTYVDIYTVRVGDVNSDGAVDDLDLINLMRFIIFGNTYPVDYFAADINNDGYITSDDVSILDDYLSGDVDRLE